MQYNIYPVPFISTIYYFKEPVYRYFIGRPAQSMSQESLVRNFKSHERVLKFVVEYYTKYEKQVSEVQKDYMQYIAFSMICTFFNIVCINLEDKKTSYRVIKEFDKFLLATNVDLYKYSNSYNILHLSRKLGYKNVLFMNAFLRLLAIIRKVRSK